MEPMDAPVADSATQVVDTLEQHLAATLQHCQRGLATCSANPLDAPAIRTDARERIKESVAHVMSAASQLLQLQTKHEEAAGEATRLTSRVQQLERELQEKDALIADALQQLRQYRERYVAVTADYNEAVKLS